MPGGLLLGLAFLLSLSWLPPPASRAALWIRIAAICSSTVIFALERANLDVGIFLLVLLALALLMRSRSAAAGYFVILLAGAAKFYPAVLLGLMVRERLVFLVSAAALACAGAVVYLLFFGHGTMVALRILPLGPPFSGIFGATNLCFGLVLVAFMPVLTLAPDAAQYLAALRHADAVALIEVGSKLLTVLAILAGIRRSRAYAQRFRELPEQPALLLVAGGMIMVFCFFLAQNISYRGIFLLMTLPALWEMRDRNMLAAVMILLWQDFLRHLVGLSGSFYPEFLIWLFCECLWWWLIIQLCALVVCFLRGELARRWGEALAW
jgi:hypothetical protein